MAITRTTLDLDARRHRLLSLAAVDEGRRKAEILRDALDMYLAAKHSDLVQAEDQKNEGA